MIKPELLDRLYELDTGKDRNQLFDFVAQTTNDFLYANDFKSCDEIFALIDPNKISEGAITILLRSTFMARTRMPYRQKFMADPVVVGKLVQSRGNVEAAAMLEGLK